MKIEVATKGFRNADAVVDSMSTMGRSEKVRRTLLDAGAVYQNALRQNLSSRILRLGTGRLYRSIRRRVSKTGGKVLIGFVYGASAYDYITGHHAHWVDKGTVMRFTKKGESRGVMPANYFWRDARASSEHRAIQIIRSGLEKTFEEIVL